MEAQTLQSALFRGSWGRRTAFFALASSLFSLGGCYTTSYSGGYEYGKYGEPNSRSAFSGGGLRSYSTGHGSTDAVIGVVVGGLLTIPLFLWSLDELLHRPLGQ